MYIYKNQKILFFIYYVTLMDHTLRVKIYNIIRLYFLFASSSLQNMIFENI